MEKNMAMWDRAIRIILGIAFLYLAFTKGGAFWILGVIGIVFIVTSLIGFCLLYKVVNFRTG